MCGKRRGQHTAWRRARRPHLMLAVMVVPQALAYGLLAGLPLEHGLFTAPIPAFVYAIFGTCVEVAVGPTAVLALLTSSALSGAGLVAVESGTSAADAEAYINVSPGLGPSVPLVAPCALTRLWPVAVVPARAGRRHALPALGGLSGRDGRGADGVHHELPLAHGWSKCPTPSVAGLLGQ